MRISDAQFTRWVNKILDCLRIDDYRQAVYWFDLCVMFGDIDRDWGRHLTLQIVARELDGIEIEREDFN